MKKQDVFLLLGILAAAALLFALIFFLGGDGDVAVVEVDGEVVARLPLDTDTEYHIQSKNGENLLIISDGKARITEADCPDKVCVHMGVLTGFNALTCLPNGVVVYLEAAS